MPLQAKKKTERMTEHLYYNKSPMWQLTLNNLPCDEEETCNVFLNKK